MAGPKPAWSAALVLLACCGSAWAAEPNSTGLQGFVADAAGAPVRGALISVFGKGLGGGGLVTFSDDEGRFSLPTVPAGSYTLRAVERGHRAAPARQIKVLPNQRAFFSVSLTPAAFEQQEPAGEGVEVSADGTTPPADAARERRFILRHRRRSVLEERGHEAGAAPAERASLSTPTPATARPSDLVDGGRLDVMANATASEDPAIPTWSMPSGFGILQFDGRLADNVTWSLGGLLAESEEASWRMAAEFVIDPGNGHHIEAGSGYGSGLLRPSRRGSDESQGGLGVLFVRDTFPLAGGLEAILGARWSYIGFVRDGNHLDPSGSLAWSHGPHRVEAAASLHTLAPGGDLLTLSSLSAAPAMTYAVMDEGLRAERITRYELAVSTAAGPLRVGARAFRERSTDQLVNLFDDDAVGGLRILNARGLVTTGVGLTLGRRLGRIASGSVDYVVGVTRRGGAVDTAAWEHPVAAGVFARDARFQDLVARIETLLEGSDTRLVAYYRVTSIAPEDGRPTHTSTRFDVQVNQGLPFLTSLTRADWDLLLAFRNLFYEEFEGGVLDELAVHNPPKRVVGGISVRF